MLLKHACLTDAGRARARNEDAVLVRSRMKLFMVADGLGGHDAGHLASSAAVRTVHEALRGSRAAGLPPSERLRRAVYQAHAEVRRVPTPLAARGAPGTTVVVLWIVDETGYIANVGDSRAYLHREGKLTRVTEDHTYVADIARLLGRPMSDEELRRHPQRNILSRALGCSSEPEVDVFEVPLHGGDQFLLCTDGLSGMLTDNELLEELMREDDVTETCRRLVERANDAGGLDNVTAAIVRVSAPCRPARAA